MPFSGKDSAGTEIITKIQLYMDKSGVISIFFLDKVKKYDKNLFIAHILQKYYILFINVLKIFF